MYPPPLSMAFVLARAEHVDSVGALPYAREPFETPDYSGAQLYTPVHHQWTNSVLCATLRHGAI